MKLKLDLKDKKIVNELDKDPNTPINTIAKNVGVSRQVAEFRLNKLINQKTIYNFYTLIDISKIGYQLFRIHLRLKNINENTYKEFARYLSNNYKTFWVAFISGAFDVIVDIFAKTSNEFENILKKILSENKEIIQNYEKLIILQMNVYNYSYFIEQKDQTLNNEIILYKEPNTLSIDEIDKKILELIAHNSRMPYLQIAQKIKTSRNTVKNRIEQLEKEKIIAGYKSIINFNHFDKQSYKIFIKYSNKNIDEEQKLFNYFKNYRSVLAVLKLFGKWNLDIEVHKEDIKTLQQFIIELRTKFDIIEDYEIIQIIEDYKINFYP